MRRKCRTTATSTRRPVRPHLPHRTPRLCPRRAINRRPVLSKQATPRSRGRRSRATSLHPTQRPVSAVRQPSSTMRLIRKWRGPRHRRLPSRSTLSRPRRKLHPRHTARTGRVTHRRLLLPRTTLQKVCMRGMFMSQFVHSQTQESWCRPHDDDV